MPVTRNSIDFFRSVSSEFTESERWTVYRTGINYAPMNGVFDLGGPLLEQLGLQFGGEMTGVVLPHFVSSPSHQFLIDEVRNRDELDLFTQVLLDSFELPRTLLPSYSVALKRAFDRGEQTFMIACVDGEPVSVGSLVDTPTSCGIWNVGTLAAFRGRGISTALVGELLKRARREEIASVLMPKGMAWGIFDRLGFEVVSEHPFYMGGASSAELEPGS